MRGGRSAPGVGAPGGSYARPLTRVAPAPPAAVCARACALSLCLLVSGQTVHSKASVNLHHFFFGLYKLEKAGKVGNLGKIDMEG